MPLLALWNHKQFVMMKLLTVPEREGKQGELQPRPIDWHSLILSTLLSRGQCGKATSVCPRDNSASSSQIRAIG